MRHDVSRPGRAVPLTLTFVFAATLVAAGPVSAQTAQAPPAPSKTPAQATAALPSARAVIDKFVEATGGRAAILAHSSTRVSGTMSIAGSGMTGAIEVLNAKPNLSLVKISISGIGEILDGFDGTTGWMLSPVMGPMVYQGKELGDRKFDADYYGDLHDASRYSSMRTVEKTTFEGRPCYKISLMRIGGGEDIEFYDVATGLKAGSIMTRATPMGEVSSTTVLSEYKKFGDLLLPSVMSQSSMGAKQDILVTAVEYDKVPPASFEAPAQIKALIK